MSIQFDNTAAGVVTLKPGASGSYSMTLPIANAAGAFTNDGSGNMSFAATGTVTSVAQSFTGGIISVGGSPVTTSGTLALTVAGTSGGIPYFSSATTWATSAALAANAIVVGGGAGVAPATVTTGTGVVTALGVNTGTAGAFVVNGGVLGTPTSGNLANCTFPTLNQSTTGSAASVVATVTGTNSTELVRGNMADNDQFRILVGGTASNAGFVELATADDGNEPIYVRQYTGTFTSIARTATLLDGSGNTIFPGSVTGTSFSGAGTGLTGTAASLSIGGNAATATTATNQSGGTVSATTGTFTGSVTVSTSNATGGGIILADDGDIVDLNDGFCAMRFSSGVRVHSGNRTGGPVITLASSGIVTAGEIRATNNITAYYSDDRLKTKLGGIQDALAKVKTLSGFYYEPNQTAQALGYAVIREVGVSAQQVQAVLPEIVVPAPIDEKYWTVRYEKLIPLLIEAIKELDAKIESLIKS